VRHRYKLQRSIVYVQVVMVCPKAEGRMQIHFTQGALVLRFKPLLPSPTAVSAVVPGGLQSLPVANKTLVYDGWGCWLYRGLRGGVDDGYLSLQLLTKVEEAV
jgi:hypothetical protein